MVGLWIYSETRKFNDLTAHDLKRKINVVLFSFEITVGFFACLYLLITLILVRRFCTELRLNGGQFDSKGHLLR